MCPHTVPRLEADRVTLRPIRLADADALWAIYGDPEVMRYASDPVFTDRSMVLQMIASVQRLLAARQSIEWAIELNATGEVIGTCGLHGFDALAREAQVGCMLGRVHWGHGLMAEALRRLLRFAWEDIEVGDLLADIDDDNVRSQALFRTLGFRRDRGILHRLQR
jgi:RimJ/RimL family protein N-acetyltransferase